MGKKIELTEAVKAELLGFAPFSTEETFSFIPKIYKDNSIIPESLKPVFKIRPFTTIERSEAIKIAANIKEYDNEILSEMARKVTMGWQNVIDVAICEEVEYKASNNGGADKVVFEKLPELIRGNIFYKALFISGLLGAEKLGLG